MEKLSLEEYTEVHPFSQEVFKGFVDLGGDRLDIIIYYEDIMFNRVASRVTMFVDSVGSVGEIAFGCPVDAKDIIKIANSMIREYQDEIAKSKDYLDRYFVQNERNSFNPKEYIEALCMDVCRLKETRRKWDKVYGFRSSCHREYCHSKVIDEIKKYMSINGDDDFYIQDLIQYLKMFIE